MAQQENAPNKPVHLMFLCGAVAAVLSAPVDDRLDLGLLRARAERVLDHRCSRGWSRSSPASCCIATIAFYDLANEVAAELKKVTWPTAKEVRAATIVVIVMADHLGDHPRRRSTSSGRKLTELVYG